MRLRGPAFRYLTALGLGLAGGMNLHRLDFDQSEAWLQQTASDLQSTVVSLSRDVAGRILPSKPSSEAGARQVAPWTEPNSANLVEQMRDDLSKRVDLVRAASESSARGLSEGLERIRSSGEQNQRELIGRIAQLGERLERFERHSAGAVVVNRSERQPPTPPARPAVKPVQHPAPPARLKAARTQPPTQTKAR